VDPLLAWLARFGLEPDRVEGGAAGAAEAEDGGGAAGWTCRLPARDEGDAASGGAARRPAAVARVLNPALAVLALVLAGVAVYVPVARQRAELAELQADLAREKRAAEATLELRETAAALGREALYLVNRKRATPSVLEVLNEITRVLPDNSYAAELRLQGRQVELVGQSGAATGLLDVVERSELFERATFRSPITRGRGGEAAERFHLAFELVDRGGEQTAAAEDGADPPERRRAGP
jgi:general secretion pathway protein L